MSEEYTKLDVLFTKKYRDKTGLDGLGFPHGNTSELLFGVTQHVPGTEIIQIWPRSFPSGHIAKAEIDAGIADPVEHVLRGMELRGLSEYADLEGKDYPYELYSMSFTDGIELIGLINAMPHDYTFAIGSGFNVVMEDGQQDDFIPVQEITSHHVQGEHAPLTIMAMAPPKGDQVALGAPAQYFDITGFCTMEQGSRRPVDGLRLVFQSGSPTVVGNNGVTLEALLAIEEYRLAKFQETKFACDHNQQALFHIRQALKHLQLRTIERLGLQPETPTLQ